MTTDAAAYPPEPIVELARAKINLTLEVLGRRSDGYHELSSLVAFADVGDLLTFAPSSGCTASSQWSIEVDGPYAGAIVGENLICKAARLIEALGAPAPSGHVILVKRLPVSSGIGGGSADAAAFLRAVRRAGERSARRSTDSSRWPPAVWLSLAAQIGADVPVCLVGGSSLMRGTGADLTSIELPSFHAVLLTPDSAPPPDKTRRVFDALAAPPLAGRRSKLPAPTFAGLDTLIAVMKSAGNDLERAALTVMPAIADARAALINSADCLHAFLSGAGPTYVGIYQTGAAADAAAQSIRSTKPKWWVTACKVGA